MKFLKRSLLVCLTYTCGWIDAAELCATNATELRNALATADGNNEHDLIKIAQEI